MSIRYYPAIIEQSSDGFYVFFPDLPGCTSAGDTTEEAAAHAEAALAMHLDTMLRDKDPIPPPTAIEQVEHDPEVQEVARILVRTELPGRVVRINVTMDEGLLSAADAAARRRGVTRSAFLADAIRSEINAAR